MTTSRFIRPDSEGTEWVMVVETDSDTFSRGLFRVFRILFGDSVDILLCNGSKENDDEH